MSRIRATVLALSGLGVLCAAAVASAAPGTPSSSEVQGISPQAATTPEPVERPVYGPIRSKDPEVRARIKELYLERNRRESEASERLAEISVELTSVSDSELELQLQRQAHDLKAGVERSNLEIGLDIARLDGDEGRAADFAHALDQLDHPEKYFPTPTYDRAKAQARARELGVDGGAE